MIEHLGAIAAVRDRIASRARDPRLLLIPGLVTDLLAIGDAFGSLEITTQTLARLALAKHFGYQLSTPEYQFLATLAGEVSPAPAADDLLAIADAFGSLERGGT